MAKDNKIATTSAGLSYNKDNAEYAFDWLVNQGATPEGAAGILSNWVIESGIDPINWENKFNDKYHMSDAELISYVDNATFTNYKDLVNAGTNKLGGVGLAQVTYPTRKEGLIDYARATERSVGDLDVQLEWVKKEMDDWGQWDYYTKATDPYQAAWEYSANNEYPDPKATDVHEAHSQSSYDLLNALYPAYQEKKKNEFNQLTTPTQVDYYNNISYPTETQQQAQQQVNYTKSSVPSKADVDNFMNTNFEVYTEGQEIANKQAQFKKLTTPQQVDYYDTVSPLTRNRIETPETPVNLSLLQSLTERLKKLK